MHGGIFAVGSYHLSMPDALKNQIMRQIYIHHCIFERSGCTTHSNVRSVTCSWPRSGHNKTLLLLDQRKINLVGCAQYSAPNQSPFEFEREFYKKTA